MRLIERLRRADLSGMGRVHALSTAADGCFAVSLAGSLFFNVSADAARPRIILYLVLTTAPFAVMAPLIGPLVGRLRGGARLGIVIASGLRAVLSFVLARQLNTLLLYPEALGILVLSKVHLVAKSALVPRLVEHEGELVAANSTLSRISTLSSAAGAVVAAGLLRSTGPGWVLVASGLLHIGAAAAALRLPRPGTAATVSRVVEYEELHAASPVLAAMAFALLRGAGGFFSFHLGFALKRAGEPAWFFGLVFGAAAAGALAGTFLAPPLRKRFHEEGMLALSVAVPAALALLASLGFSRLRTLTAALGLGVGSNVARQAFDSLIQRDAPDADVARTFGRFETQFQLAWVSGALLAVVLRLRAWAGLLLVGVVLGLGAVLYTTTSKALARRPPPRTAMSGWARAVAARLGRLPLGVETLLAAERLATDGAYRQVVVQAALAVDLVIDEFGVTNLAAPADPDTVAGDHDELRTMRDAAVQPGAVVSPATASRAVEIAERLITRLSSPSPPDRPAP
jgi:hypothetical protein